MLISGLQKLTLLDFPNHVACTIFLKGCNFRCPFCQNKDLVLPEAKTTYYTEEEILDFIEKRKNVLDGVCFTGGEPTLHKDLADLMKKVKMLGLKVKLDTNGYNPDALIDLVNNKLVDYVAMDIKNSFQKYDLTTGIKFVDTSKIQKSIDFLKRGTIPYEFRTTVVKEYHNVSDFIDIAKTLQGASKYYLQKFEDSDTCISRGLHAPTDGEMKNYLNILKTLGINAFIRGED